MNKTTFAEILESRMTKSTAQFKALEIPVIARGNEMACFHLRGATVEMSKTSPYKGIAVIQKITSQNGYASYEAKVGKAITYLRESDINLNWENVYKTELAKAKLFGEIFPA